MADDETRDDETPREREEQAETGETPAESHREGEFAVLRDMLAGITVKLDALSKVIVGLGVATPSDVPPESDDDKIIDIDDLDL